MPSSFERLRDYVGTAAALGTGPRAAAAILWHQTKNLRVRLHLARYRPNTVYAVETIYGLLHLRDNFGDVTNLAGLLYRQVYGVQRLDRPGVVLDVGANIGLAAALFAHYNSDRTIYCFEPLPSNVGLIRRNCPNARVVACAVGAAHGRVQLDVDADGVMASRIPCRWPTTSAEFDVITLDEFAASEGIGEVALLKIDAEGMEDEILAGGGATLGRTHRVVLETHGRQRHDAVLHRLRERGFEIDSEVFGKATGFVAATRRRVAALQPGRST
jgi:FkbM family methyltransferase